MRYFIMVMASFGNEIIERGERKYKSVGLPGPGYHRPMRGQYPGHVINLDQSKVIIQVS